MNYLDLFSGIAGFRLGFEQAGWVFDYESHSEINKYANKVYANHYPQSKEIGDVRNVIQRIGDKQIDLITFGFPCQDLSVAGRREGLSGERSGLFYEAIKIIKHFKPEIFIFENVEGILSNHEGRDFIEILRTIANIGLYDCQWQLLDTRWVLPQNRSRLYFIGLARGKCTRQVFPVRSSDEEFVQKCTENEGQEDIATALRARDYKTNILAIPLKFLKRNQKNYQGKVAFTIDRCHSGGILIDHRYRKFTPKECLRLQGFPDTWCDGLSDTQVYNLVGNAVSVPIVKLIARRLK